MRTGRCTRRLLGHTSTVQAIAADASGRTAVSGAVDGSLVLWDLGSGRCVGRLQQESLGVPYVVMDCSGSTAMSMSEGCPDLLRVWDIRRLVCTATHKCPAVNEPLQLLASPDLTCVALLDSVQGRLEAWC